jgi:Na+-driven multidrug efflux pump
MLYSGLFYLPILMILELFPGMVLRLFNASEHMMAIGIPAVRIMAVAWLVFIPSLVFAAALQGLSIPKPSMLLTMLRQAILPVLLAFLLSRTGWLPSVWLAFVVSELVCIPLAMLFWKRNWSPLRISMERVSKNDAIIKEP